MIFVGRILVVPSTTDAVVSAGAPVIDVEVTMGGPPILVQFTIDTGAEVTVLSPDDARDVMGVEYEYLDSRLAPRRIGVRGFGGVRPGVPLEAHLTFRYLDAEYQISQPIVVAPPSADRIAQQPFPSLLGRDFLRHFRFELVYGDAPQVLLETL